jgi:glyoxylase-like metal-dependent hydrolase (beta-lactamase superfamily II)
MQAFRVWGDVYIVGGPAISHPLDCCVYLINTGKLILIDAGTGNSFSLLINNIRRLGLIPENLAFIIATHRHIDHVGGLAEFKQVYNVKTIAHELDADAIESGQGVGAEFYGIKYHPCSIDIRLTENETELNLGKHTLKILHIPGHTSGSLAIYLDIGSKRVLFGQDLHGPYETVFGGDVCQAIVSLRKLLELNADILCEGHYGICQPATEVSQYIKDYLNLLERRTFR